MFSPLGWWVLHERCHMSRGSSADLIQYKVYIQCVWPVLLLSPSLFRAILAISSTISSCSHTLSAMPGSFFVNRPRGEKENVPMPRYPLRLHIFQQATFISITVASRRSRRHILIKLTCRRYSALCSLSRERRSKILWLLVSLSSSLFWMLR